MKKRLQKMLSLMLVVSFLVSMLSTVAFADGIVDAEAAANPQFTVQYYAEIDELASSGENPVKIIDTAGGVMPSNELGENQKQKTIYLEDSDGKSDNALNGTIQRKTTLEEIYSSRTFHYYQAPGLNYIDLVSRDDGNYTLKEVKVSTDDGQNWTTYSKENLYFTNGNVQVSGTPIVITDKTIIRLIYNPTTDAEHTFDTTFFDYNITDGALYAKDANGNLYKSPSGNYVKIAKQGINSYVSKLVGNDAKAAKFGFGNDTAKTGLESEMYNGYNINKANTSKWLPRPTEAYNPNKDPWKTYINQVYFKKCSYGIVSGLNENGALKFSDGIIAPDLFGTSTVEGKTPHEGKMGFSRKGDAYYLSFAQVGSQEREANLNVLTRDAYIKNMWTNNFWPLDDVEGGDPKFGDHSNKTYSYQYTNAEGTTSESTLPESDNKADHNAYFGLTYEVNFRLPKDYVGPMNYMFFGDDDMWVFLVKQKADGETWDWANTKLVCDIGGVHQSVGEFVNLWDHIDTPRVDDGINGSSDVGYEEYKLVFFYTERGASGSTCYMEFTLPQVHPIVPVVPRGSLTLEKEVVDGGTGETYEFTVALKDAEGQTTKLSSEMYSCVYKTTADTEPQYIVFKGSEVGSKTNEVLKFSLGHGGTATINNLPVGVEYTITEKTGKYTTTTAVNGGPPVRGSTVSDIIEASTARAAEGDTIVDNDVVTFTNSPLIDIPVTKTWVDFDNAYQTRPDSITIRLKANDTEVEYKEVKAENGWSCTFENKSKYDEDGREIFYTITEDKVNGYLDAVINGYDVTNTLLTTSVSGTKTWDDNNNEYGNRPGSITINLTGKPDGSEQEVVSQSKTVTAADGWNYSFTNLPEYYDGREIFYTITEDDVPYYNSKVDGNNVTNTPETTEVTITKMWVDNDDQDGIRPNDITLHLYKIENDTQTRVFETPTRVKLGNNKWRYTFSDLPKYKNGEEIVYTIKEMPVEGYTSSEVTWDSRVGCFEVTNTHIPATIDIPVTKEWRDNNDQDGLRPDSIWVYLCADDTVVDEVYLTGADTTNFWYHTFTGMPKYQNGNEIQYSVHEQVPDGYWVKVDKNDPYKLINIYDPEKTSIVVTKIWDDSSDQDGIRPEEVTIELVYKTQKDATLRGPVEIQTLSEANNWTCTFEALDVYTNHGDTVIYEVREKKLSGYTPSYSDVTNGSVIVTNIHKSETVIVSGTKTWIDNDDQDGIRPKSITINLLANGEKIDSKTVTAGNGWKWNFGNLPKFANGKAITYTITEDDVADYDGKVRGYDVINKHIPGTTSVSGAKTWNDGNDQDGIRPESITINLLADGVKVDSKSVTAADGWKYTFANLNKMKAGKEITYTITENPVEGYTTTVDGYNVTNTHEPTIIPVDPDPKPEPEPEPKPDPKPEIPVIIPDPKPEIPVITPDPKPGDPTEELGEDDIPMGGRDHDRGEEMLEEEVPLAGVPKTGDISLLWAATAVASGLGLAGLKLSDKKRKDDEED